VAGLVPAIRLGRANPKTRMPGAGPGMTDFKIDEFV
jgi:hypothetical protein